MQITTPNESNIPGAAGVIRTQDGFYCTPCKKLIQPIMIEVEGEEIAACEDCALEDMILMGAEFMDAKSIECPLEAAVGAAEDELWENMLL